MAGFDFVVGLQVTFFLFSLWAFGWLFNKLRLPSILGTLFIGVLLGPQGFDLVPYASNGACQPGLMPYDLYAYEANASDPCASASGSATGRMLAATGEASCTDVSWVRFHPDKHIKSFWTFIGNAGVTLMIMESGMHIHFDKVKEVGMQALLVAVVGTGFPIILGFVVVGALFQGLYPDYSFYPFGFAAGCAFAPTSVGISIKLLDESKMLNSIAGQTTLTAAFIDDVFSLVTLVILQKLAEGQPRAIDIIMPLICSFAFLGLGVWLAVRVFPALPTFLDKIKLRPNVPIQMRDELHLFLMFASLAFFGWISSVGDVQGVPFIGSHLLGAFVAGMVWVNVPRSHQIWQAQLKRVVRWMMRVFFACTVGFAVPVADLLKWNAIWKGLILGIGPCIGTKLVSGIFACQRFKTDDDKAMAIKASWATKYCQPQQLLVGIAMVARGEFAYLVAETAQTIVYADGDPGTVMMAKEVYASVVVALVMATICSPVMFRWAIGVFDRATPIHRSEFIGGEDKKFQKRAFVIRLAGSYTPGVQREIFDALHSSGVDILEARLVTMRGGDEPDAKITHFVNNFTVLSRGKKKDFDNEKLEEMQHMFAEVLNDADAQIIFEPYDEDFSADGIIEVQVLSEHHPSVLHELTDRLAEMGLDVIKATVHHGLQPGVHRESQSGPAAAPSPAPPGAMQQGRRTPEEVSVTVTGRDGRMTPPARFSRSDSQKWMTHVMHRSTKGGSQKIQKMAVRRKSHEGAHDGAPSGARHSEHTHQVGREVFYARESDGGRATTCARRNTIRDELHKVLESHGLHGEVFVRLLHESEMAIAHTIPRLGENKDIMCVVKCVGKHHKELLHEICDTIDAEELDVVHADMDVSEAGDINVFYVQKKDETPLTSDKRHALKAALSHLYDSHALPFEVEVKKCASPGRKQSPRTGEPKNWMKPTIVDASSRELMLNISAPNASATAASLDDEPESPLPSP